MNLISNKKRLAVIGDVSCDPNGPFNPLPIYSEITSWEEPTFQVKDIHLLAIDNHL